MKKQYIPMTVEDSKIWYQLRMVQASYERGEAGFEWRARCARGDISDEIAMYRCVEDGRRA